MPEAHWHVLGAGAIGSLFGAALHRSGCRSTLILRRSDGRSTSPVVVQGKSPWGEMQLPVFCPTNNSAPISHLLVTTKAYDVYDAVAGIAPHLASNCTLLLLINGMGLAEQLQAQWPQLEIYCGTTTEGAYRLGAQHVHHAGSGETRIGRRGQTEPSAWFEAWSRALDNCLWENDIEEALWSKLAVNCVINPLTALHRCPNGDLARRPELAAQVMGLCDEVAMISRVAGFSRVASTLQHTVHEVIAGTAQNRSSMLQDIEKGAATEIDYITGYLLQVAAQHNIDAPLNTTLLQSVKNSVR